jgi:hypothetical protein
MSYIVTKQTKSTGVAVLLTCLFGGIGLFYASIVGGIIMTLFFPVIVFFLFFTGHFIASIGLACSYYIICIIWSIVSVASYNRKIQTESSLLVAYRHTPLQIADDNYYDQYRKSLKKDRSFLWAIITIILCSLFFYLALHYKVS